MNPNTRAATAFVQTLALGGVRHAVVSPGSRNTPLALAFAEESSIEVHPIVDERSAGFVALGLARATASPVALSCTSGSAAAHYLPAVIEANLGRIPLLILSADRPQELQDVGAPQTIRQRALFSEHVRWSGATDAPRAASCANAWRSRALQCLSESLGAEPGPVHLNLPFREPLWEEGEDGGTPLEPGRWTRPTALISPLIAEELADALKGRKKGVLVCGPDSGGPSGERNGRLARAVTGLASALGWPVLAEPASGLRFGRHDKGPLIVSGDALLRDATFAREHQPDFVLRFGALPTSKAVHRWLATAKEYALVDPYGRWTDPFHSATRLISAPCAAFAEELQGRTKGVEAPPEWLASWKRADAACAATLESHAKEGFWEGSLARSLVHHLQDGEALHLSNSMPIRDIESFGGTLDIPVRVFCSRGANGIDGTVSTAAGEAMGWDKGPTTLLVGDVTFRHDLSGLACLTQRGISLRIVLVDNGGGGIFKFLPIAKHPEHFEELFTTPTGLSLPDVCASLGVSVRSVDTLSAFEEAMSQPYEGIHVIHATVRADENVRRHHDAWRAGNDAARAT